MSVDRTEVLVSQDVTEVLVPAEVTEVLVPTGNVIIVSASGPGGGGGVTDHQALTGRSSADAHPQSAITGLVAALQALTNADAQEVIDRNAAISAAIAALVASAPGVLDTLDEIAAALGDDPNFATTITTLLAGKQPLDSDLTAIAALITTAFGRNLLTLADAAALLTLLGLDSATLAEFIRDTIGSALVAGTGITLGVDDAGNTITITSIATGTPPASAVPLQDAGGYYTTDNVEAALQQLGPALNTGQLLKLTAGFTANKGSLDKWKAGTGKIGTRITKALTSGTLTCGVLDPMTADTMPPRVMYLEDEAVYVTGVSAGRSVTDAVTNSTTTITSATASFTSADVGRLVSGTGIPADTWIDSVTNSTTAVLSAAATTSTSGVSLTFGPLLNLIRGEQGTTAAAHAARTEITRRRRRVVAVLGDSIVQGIATDGSRSSDPWVDRFHRASGERYGGVSGKAWPNWRNTAAVSPHHEWQGVGFVTTVAGTTSEVGYGGSYAATQINAGTGNYWKWTRPGGEQVAAIEILIVDVGGTSCEGSYSIDGGTTWTDYPLTTRYVSGPGILRSFLVACDNPDEVRIRGANKAGTAKAVVMPSVPLYTYSVFPWPITDGMAMLSFGWGGMKLRNTLNARSATDAVVTNGSPVVTSASSAFVTLDAGGTVYLEHVPYTVLTRDSATQITLTSNYLGTSGSGKRITLFGDSTGDRLAAITGHPASVNPDLVILGPFSNDFVPTSPALGDGDEQAYYDLMTYTVKRLKAAGANVVMVPCYERNPATSASSGVQLAYRNVIATVAAEQACAVFDMYAVAAAWGAVGYTGINAEGWLADGTHPSELGHQFYGARFTDMLEFA